MTSVIMYVPEDQFLYDRDMEKAAAADACVQEKLAAAGATALKTSRIAGGGLHCQLFCDSIDTFDIEKLGPEIEYSDIFNAPACFEFIKVVDASTIRLKIWDGANGAVLSSASAAFCAARMAVEEGYCRGDKEITVETPGGDILVNFLEGQISLTAEVSFAFSGKFWY